jgi:hypothetical protein
MKMYPQLKLLFAIAFLISVTGSSQTVIKPDVSKTTDFLEEVYAGEMTNLGFDKPQRIEQYQQILSRIEIIEHTENLPGKVFLLSQVPLINVYNPNLSDDLGENFDPYTFNPFKYKMDFFRNDALVRYKVDGTNYVIQILP